MTSDIGQDFYLFIQVNKTPGFWNQVPVRAKPDGNRLLVKRDRLESRMLRPYRRLTSGPGFFFK